MVEWRDSGSTRAITESPCFNGASSFTLIRAAAEDAYAGSGGYLTAGSSLVGPDTAVEGFSRASCCGTPNVYGVKLFTTLNTAPAQTWIFGQATDAPTGRVSGIESADFDGNGTQDFVVLEQDVNTNSTLHVYLNLNK